MEAWPAFWGTSALIVFGVLPADGAMSVATMLTAPAGGQEDVSATDREVHESIAVKTTYLLRPDKTLRAITPTPGEGWYGTPSIHPCGTSVVFAGAKRGNGRLWKYTVETEEVVPLTPETFCSKLPSYSPDGRSIVFASDRDLDHPRFDLFEVGRTRPHDDGFKGGMTGPSNLYVMEADGRGMRRLTTGDHFDSRPSFSPDGRTIVFHSNRVGAETLFLWTVPADGSSLPTKVELDDDPWVGCPRFSADGKELFFFTGMKDGAYEPRGRHTLCRVSVRGGAWSPLASDQVGIGSHGPQPDPDGETLWYHANVDRMWRLYRLPLTGDGTPSRFTPAGFANAHIAHPSVASDGALAFDSRSDIRPQ